MIRYRALLLLLTVQLSHPANAQVIAPVDQRTQLLDRMQAVLTNTERPSLEVSALSSPFRLPVEAPSAVAAPVAATREEATDSEVDAPTILPDAVALEAIAGRFQPLGSLVMGDRGILQLPNSRTIEAGERFRAEIRGVAYEVLVEEVTQQGYRLRLGGAQLDRTFTKAGR
jgi:hypothetical protein